MTIVLTDRDGEEVGTFEFLEFQQVGGEGLLENGTRLPTISTRLPTISTRLPTISGTARVGETLTADTSRISDDDGLDNATYTYQ